MISSALTISADAFAGAGIDPTVATVSSESTKPSQTFASVVRTKPIVPAASSAAIMSPSWPRRRVKATRSVVIGTSSSVVVGLAGEDLVAAVELFEQDDAGKLMRQRHRAEREAVVDPLELPAEPAADDEAELAPRPTAGARKTAGSP